MFARETLQRTQQWGSCHLSVSSCSSQASPSWQQARAGITIMGDAESKGAKRKHTTTIDQWYNDFPDP